MLPPGKSDLEILESLKKMIKDGQHEFYRAVPQPTALASLYLGPPSHSNGSSRPHQDALPTDYALLPGQHSNADTSGFSGSDTRRFAGDQRKDWDAARRNHTDANHRYHPTADNAASHPPASATSASGLETLADVKPLIPSSDDKRPEDMHRSISDRAGEYREGHPSPGKSGFDKTRDNGFSDDRRRLEDRLGPSPGRSANGPGQYDRPNTDANARLPPRDQRAFDKDKDIRDKDVKDNKDNVRDRDRERDRDFWDRDRERRTDYPRSYGRSFAPRPPPDQRHYEPKYSPEYLASRRFDNEDDRGPRTLVDDRRPPANDDRDRLPRALPSVDRDRSMPRDDRVRMPPANDLSSPDRDRLASDTRPPLPSAGDDRLSRAAVPLEERISQAPSLQDRIGQPAHAASRLDDKNARPPSLEERLSHPAPASASERPPVDDRGTRPLDPPLPVASNRLGLGPSNDRGRPSVNDRFARPASPDRSASIRPNVYPPPVVRSPSAVRPDSRAGKDILPPLNDRADAREFRPPPRSVSREQADVRPPYRSEPDRVFNDSRRPDLMDVDPPSRYAESRGNAFRRPPSPPLSSASAGKGIYTRSPSRADTAPVPISAYDADLDRRYPPGDQRDWQYERRRDWGADERPPYRSWDSRPPPPLERPPFDREPPARAVPGAGSWDARDARDDRDRRPLPYSTSSDSTRPLGSRPDTFPPPYPADDRAYRDLDRARYPPADTAPPPPFSRVRGRSPSPIRRNGPGGAPIDDMRPPLKRTRDDASYAGPGPGGFYGRSPPRRDSVASDYPRSVATPPPSSGGSGSFYDGRGGLPPPPPFSGASASSASLGRDRDRDREYPPLPPPLSRDRDGPGYAAAPYDRDRDIRGRSPPRVPLPPIGRGGYGRPPDVRDDRRYMPPPPPRP
ncbi:hypothetical protein CONPUDRAFT_136503 [Coniophora puteana RWD-64-598 SS2]|uniref:Uncharacterized protein n=1 Tax=Coniophora puteana (strain RWD-64-598) TaxID=741705 RepID=A0A5M3MWM9_CONPW|nr:uncharacterized protein CONPUDRAFT_136503 [Coniophora puteana RWD-64-598 SS2]EIW83553.1 hypothetical protein CONPUDRAFT_136503 [Coniophora puteana RWD-64-598 SS2]